MNVLNIEIKTRANNLDELETILLQNGADFKGLDHQIDTYFKVNEGRLKLRQGNIESSLIFYNRIETKGLKKSEVDLQHLPPNTDALKRILTQSFGVWKVVDKKRKIFFIDNVKFHLDTVKEVGTFVEIEAIDKELNIGEKRLSEQCDYYVDLLKIDRADFVAQSYSDMV